MPLMIQFRKGRACPTIICDQCQQPITDAKDGGYFYPLARCDGEVVPMTFLHKGDCNRVYSATHGRLACWTELTCLPFFLVNNLHTSWKRCQERGRLIASIG
jgi:hypothetical protein